MIQDRASESESSSPTWQTRKQQHARDEIWDAAIDLFAEKGFDETTVDDIAMASGASRRTFFRYFRSKSDLMAQGVLSYGTLITETIDACPRNWKSGQVLRETVLQVARKAAAHPRTVKIVRIAEKYPAAREAQMAGMPAVQRQVSAAFARRTNQMMDDLTPRILASLTHSMIEMVLHEWLRDRGLDLPGTTQQVFATLCSMVCHSAGPGTGAR